VVFNCLITLISVLLLISLPFNVSTAEIICSDSVVFKNQEFFVGAQTRGRFFPEGGRIVRFYLNNRLIGRTLSGGDGYAYLEQRFKRAGLYRIKARSDDDTCYCSVMVLGVKDRLVLVQLEGVVFNIPFLGELKDGSREVLKELKGHYRIVYVTLLPAIHKLKQWLREKGLPESVVVNFDPQEFKTLKTKGVSITALVDSSDVLGSFLSDVDRCFSFKESEGCETVEDWREIKGRIQKGYAP